MYNYYAVIFRPDGGFVEYVWGLALNERYTIEDARTLIKPIQPLLPEYSIPKSEYFPSHFNRYAIKIVSRVEYIANYFNKPYIANPCLIPFIDSINEKIRLLNGDTAPPVAAPVKPVDITKTNRRKKDLTDILADIVSEIETGKLKTPLLETENRQWILREKLNANPKTLRQYRTDGRKQTLTDESIIGIDSIKQVYWQPTEGSKKVFYLKRTVH